VKNGSSQESGGLARRKATVMNMVYRRLRWVSILAFAWAAVASGCEEDTPQATPVAGTAGTAGAAGIDAGGAAGTTGDAAPDTDASSDAPLPEAGEDVDAAQPVVCNDTDITTQDNATCTALGTDYTPAASANDTWAACISDDNTYHPFDVNISSIARVGAFVSISTLLSFGTETAPTVQSFTDARLAYQTDQGLESRVSRREDEHYAAAFLACNTMTPTELAQYPDRCVGPVKIQPILNAAFAEGMTGTSPALNAARIEAALLWFLYVSVYKECTTCTKTVADCDSGYAYYTGGEPRSGGLGLSNYVKVRSPQAHDRIWDGLLAIRCWRDLDNPTGTATDLTLRDRARAELDTALLRGVALIVRQRAQKATCPAMWEFVRILGPVLNREAAVRDATKAQVLATEFAKANGADVDIPALTTALDAVFPCP
jgi:hypothetical protein